ncbi:MAG: phytoene desaturase [Rhodothermales bacterium]
MSWIDNLVTRDDADLNTRTEPLPIGPDAPHAVVIGAGFGGLAAAIRLGVRGYRVTVVDRLDQPGGRARVFEQNGFKFDGGPTVVTAPFLFEELWALCGKDMADDIDLRPVTPFYRIRFDDGTTFDYTGDPEAMKREIEKFSPEDVDGYTRFFEKSKDIFKVGFEELAHVPFGRVMDMAKIVPAMMKLESYRTVYGLVSKYVKHDKIRQVLSFHPLLVGGNPFNVTSIYTLIAFLERKWGVHYAMGGTGAIVQGLVGLLSDLGGTLRLNADVQEITVENGAATGLQLTSGETIPADVVISNADIAWTYRHLLPESSRQRWTNRRVENLRMSMSLFVWYFGTKKHYPDVAHHTILLGQRYKTLLDDIFEKKVLADDFSLYLHRPTATDPSMAPEGCDAFYVLSPVPHLDSGVKWTPEQTERYRLAVSQYLNDSLLPDLEENLAASVTLTPQGFLDDYLSFKGAAFSIEPVLTQSAYFRPHNKSEDVEHLYFVGGGTHPGAGMPGVLSTARVLDTLLPDADAFPKQKGALQAA